MEQIKSRVLILGGTSEGRELSRFAHDIGLSATVSTLLFICSISALLLLFFFPLQSLL